ncbi:HD domain-containing protein, partial [Thermogutta sp.]|uniref:[protein-PII] uridylyltransferase family protein n=1 Tax=Thermogutta sp. TaxID=1962930 RepID=UPI00321FF708
MNRTSGVSVGRRLAALWDSIITKMWAHEMEEAGADEKSTGSYALLALGGFGRSIVAPYSDIDLLLFTPGRASPVLRAVSAGFYRDMFDLGWQLGFSTHTNRTVMRHILKDPQFLTGVLQARLLCGDLDVFRNFHQLLERTVRRYGERLLGDVILARDSERERYGETVYILQPNVKRSPGGIRDVQLIHWIQRFAELGVELSGWSTLEPEDAAALSEAEDFLWAVRQWLHWRAGRVHDVLTRSDQWQLATTWGYSGEHNLLPAEVFMRDYFRKTEHVFVVAQRFSECARSPHRKRNFFVTRLHNAYLIERGDCLAITSGGQVALARGWGLLLEFLETSQQLNRPLDWTVWDSIRRHMSDLSGPIPPEIFRRFAALFESPNQLAHLLRGLHKVRLLERFLPVFEHARGLLQFNQYHHYTVDEHSLRAVEAATSLTDAPGLLGDTYRRIAQKKILHLALLLHDLGKGLGPDHCEVGREI